MSDYRVFETEQFAKDIDALTRAGRQPVVDKLRKVVYPQLRRHPHFGPNIRKLKAYSPDTWRYRIGAWRFFFELVEEERLVVMVAASHRGSAY